MKIVVLYGEDEAAARARFVQIVKGVKKKNWEVVSLDVRGKFTLADKLTSQSLFPEESLFTLDNLKNVSASELKWLVKNSSKYEGSLLIFCKGSLPQGVKASLPKSTKYENFEIPKVLFIFLESFYPGNSKRALKLLEELLADNQTEFAIAMLARHLRDLYWVLDGASGMNLPNWRAAKLGSQAQKFTKQSLKDTISSLADVDIKSKTGMGDARFLLELLIIEKLS